jgi:hypothetical protein
MTETKYKADAPIQDDGRITISDMDRKTGGYGHIRKLG